VLVISDDHGYRDFGFMGSEAVETPTLDALAARGTVFPYGYSTSSVCRPALRALLTGLSPAQWSHEVEALGLPRGGRRAGDAIAYLDTLPRLLARADYATFQAGKYWEGHYERAGFSDRMTAPESREDPGSGGAGLRLSRDTLAPVEDFLDRHDARPFFVWFAPMLPHLPHDAGQRFEALYRDAAITPAERAYYANVSRLDAVVGELLDALERRDLCDSTLVVVLSDNGWEVAVGGEGGLWGGARGKGSLYELGLRTPILFHWRGRIPSGERLDALVSILDVVPTLLDYAGVEAPAALTGRSLRPLIEGRGSVLRDAIVLRVDSARPEAGGTTGVAGYAVRSPDWYYVRHDAGGREELYDALADPDQQRALAAVRPDVLERMRARLPESLPTRADASSPRGQGDR